MGCSSPNTGIRHRLVGTEKGLYQVLYYLGGQKTIRLQAPLFCKTQKKNPLFPKTLKSKTMLRDHSPFLSVLQLQAPSLESASGVLHWGPQAETNHSNSHAVATSMRPGAHCLATWFPGPSRSPEHPSLPLCAWIPEEGKGETLTSLHLNLPVQASMHLEGFTFPTNPSLFPG